MEAGELAAQGDADQAFLDDQADGVAGLVVRIPLVHRWPVLPEDDATGAPLEMPRTGAAARDGAAEDHGGVAARVRRYHDLHSHHEFRNDGACCGSGTPYGSQGS